MYKSCSKCGKIHDINYRCKAIKYNYTGEERKLRSSYQWTKKSQEIREKAQYLCEVCRDRNVFTYKDIEIHHIEKVRDNPSLLLDDLNLVCLCIEHHRQADAGEIDADYLRHLATVREGR